MKDICVYWLYVIYYSYKDLPKFSNKVYETSIALISETKDSRMDFLSLARLFFNDSKLTEVSV